MPHAELIVKDQCNVRFTGLDPVVRRQLSDAVRFKIPGAQHTPQVKLGRWDGTMSFCSAASATYLNLLDRLLSIVIDHGYDITIDDRRPVYKFRLPPVTDDVFADRTWPIGHPAAGEPIMLRDYQVDAINRFVANLQSVQEIPTGAGKTLLTATMSWLCEAHGRSIVIVPSKSLVGQTERDYRNLGLDVGVYYGKRKEWGHRHTICTWQSLAVFAKRTRRDEAEIPIDEFIRDVICVIVDEAHSSKAKVLRDLLTGPFAHIPIRWGLTGTIPKEEHEWLCLLAAIGPKVGEIKSYELQDCGVLAQSHVNIVQMIDDHVEFRNYKAEHDFLLSDSDRLQYLATLIQTWASSNTIVLVDFVKTGQTLQSLIPDSVFISGDVEEKIRAAEYQSFQFMDGKVIVATYGVLSTGIDLPRIFNVVFLEPGKSFIRVIQSLGRGLRKTQDKQSVRIYDVCSTLRFSKRHLAKRKLYYDEAKHPHTMQKVSYR